MTPDARMMSARDPGGYQQRFWRGGLRPDVQPLAYPFYTPFLREKVSLSFTIYWKIESLSNTQFPEL